MEQKEQSNNMEQFDPWNESSSKNDSEPAENGFQDNFTVDKETVLDLPDSEKYLQGLERKLSKIQPKTVIDPQMNKRSQKLLAKDLINSLKAKRDEIFKEELGPDKEFDEADQTTIQAIQQRIMQTEVFKEVTRKFAPHLLAVDGDELKTLTFFDFLNNITEQDDDDDKSQHSQDKTT